MLVQKFCAFPPHQRESNLNSHQYVVYARQDFLFQHTPSALEVFPTILKSICQGFGTKGMFLWTIHHQLIYFNNVRKLLIDLIHDLYPNVGLIYKKE